MIESISLESDPAEKERLRQSIQRRIKQDPSSVQSSDIPAIVREVATSELRSVVSRLVQGDTRNYDTVILSYIELPAGSKKEELHRALLNSYVQDPKLANGVDLTPLVTKGLRYSIAIHKVPLEENGGFGLSTDLFLMSQIHLRRLGSVRFLPLPERFPQPKTIGENEIVDCGDRDETLEFFGYQREEETVFGRSTRFPVKGTRPAANTMHAYKQAEGDSSNEALTKLRFEAKLMKYLAQYRNYFGLESIIPIPALGPGNRTPAWRLSDRDHLLYAASSRYFTYPDEASSSEELRNSLLINVRDLMRLARFGIFHTELAPIFHNKADMRPYRWNIGGFQPGAGKLDRWEEAFRYSNMRLSGIADFEHLIRYPELKGVSEMTHGFSDQQEQGLQYLLGNTVFCALHIAGLWYRKNDSFTIHADDLKATVSALLKESFKAFTGSDWQSFNDDINLREVVREMQRFMSAQPGDGSYFSTRDGVADLGAVRGAYPAHELIKAITAFTLKAIPTFVESRTQLNRNLPERKPDQVIPFGETLPTDIPGLVSIQEQIISLKSRIASTLATYGILPEEADQLTGFLRPVDIKEVVYSVNGCFFQTIAIRVRRIKQALKENISPLRYDQLIARLEEDSIKIQMSPESRAEKWLLHRIHGGN